MIKLLSISQGIIPKPPLPVEGDAITHPNMCLQCFDLLCEDTIFRFCHSLVDFPAHSLAYLRLSAPSTPISAHSRSLPHMLMHEYLWENDKSPIFPFLIPEIHCFIRSESAGNLWNGLPCSSLWLQSKAIHCLPSLLSCLLDIAMSYVTRVTKANLRTRWPTVVVM